MKKVYLIFTTVLISVILFAQEKTTKVDVNLNKDGNNAEWYASPWVWIVGAAVFIILLVALTSGGRSRRSSTTSGDRVTVTKTVERDTDV